MTREHCVARAGVMGVGTCDIARVCRHFYYARQGGYRYMHCMWLQIAGFKLVKHDVHSTDFDALA